MTLRAAIRKAMQPGERSLRKVSVGLPALQPLRWGARHCRICGQTVERGRRCADCQIPFSARLLNLRILLERKTPGVYRAGEDYDTPTIRAERWTEEYGPDSQLVADDLLPHDARWIAAAANVLPELLDEYDKLRAELEALRKKEDHEN